MHENDATYATIHDNARPPLRARRTNPRDSADGVSRTRCVTAQRSFRPVAEHLDERHDAQDRPAFLCNDPVPEGGAI